MVHLKFILILVCNLLLSSQHLWGQAPVDELLDTLNGYLTKHGFPGAMISIVSADSIIYVGGIGYANIEEEEAVNQQHLFRQGSISKSFTALGLLHVMKTKGLSLNTPIDQIDPTIPFDNKWSKSSPITVASVLENSAGFDDFHAHAIYNFTDEKQPAAFTMVEAHKNSLYARWKPNTRHAYSNSGYILAGHLIEVLSGQPYSTYIKEQILIPLGMQASGFYFKQPDLPFAQGYDNASHPMDFVSLQAGPAGNFCSNAEEMAIYLQFMLRRAGHLIDSSLFSAETFDRIEYPQTTLAAQNGFRVGYALGNFSVLQNGYLFHGHNGGIDGYSSRYVYSRKADLGIAIAVNKTEDPTPMVKIILDHFLGDMDTAPADRHVESIPQALKDEFSGFYVFRNPRNQLKAFIDNFARNVRLEFQGEKAYLKDMFGGIRDSLTYAGNNQFYRNIQPIPTFIVMETEEGQKAIGMKRDYAEKESFFFIMVQNIMILLSMILSMIYLAYFGLWVLFQLFKKKWKTLPNRIPLMIACLSFPVLFFSFGTAVSVRETAGQLTFWSGLLYVSAIIMILFSAWAGYQTVNMKGEKISFRVYHLMTTVAILIVGIFLWQNGFLGLKLWSY